MGGECTSVTLQAEEGSLFHIVQAFSIRSEKVGRFFSRVSRYACLRFLLPTRSDEKGVLSVGSIPV